MWIMRFKVLLFIFSLGLISGQEFRVAPSNIPGGESLCFATHERGLAWPLGSSWDFDTLLRHGVHCLKQLQRIALKRPLSSIEDRAHFSHCTEHTEKVIQHMMGIPDFFKSLGAMCQAIRKIMMGPTKPEGRPVQEKEQLRMRRAAGFGSRLRTSFGDSGSRARYPPPRDWEPWQRPRPRPRPCCESRERTRWGRAASPSEQDTQSVKDQQTKPKQIFDILAGSAQDQYDLYDAVAGWNVGNLNIKVFRNQSLTLEEREYLDGWTRPLALQMSGLGMYCMMEDLSPDPIAQLQQFWVNVTKRDDQN